MVRMINRLTGTPMLVADDRVDKYLAKGHKLADEKPEKKAPKKTEKKAEKKPAAKKATKKTTKKK